MVRMVVIMLLGLRNELARWRRFSVFQSHIFVGLLNTSGEIRSSGTGG